MGKSLNARGKQSHNTRARRLAQKRKEKEQAQKKSK